MLGAILIIIAGVAAIAVGVLMVLAGGQSDDPVAGEAAASHGCVVGFVGLLVLIIGAASAIHGLL